MFPGETVHTGANGGEFGTNGYSQIQVMKSPAGYYLGTTYNNMPGTRETEYFFNEKDAEDALSQWQRGIPAFARTEGYKGI